MDNSAALLSFHFQLALLSSVLFFFASPSISSISSFPSFPSYSPCYPLSSRISVCCLFPDGLIGVFLCFVRCPRTRSALRSLFRYSASPFAEGLPASWSERLIMMCHRNSRDPRAIFSCSHPHKNRGCLRRVSTRSSSRDDCRGCHSPPAANRTKGALPLLPLRRVARPRPLHGARPPPPLIARALSRPRARSTSYRLTLRCCLVLMLVD